MFLFVINWDSEKANITIFINAFIPRLNRCEVPNIPLKSKTLLYIDVLCSFTLFLIFLTVTMSRGRP